MADTQKLKMLTNKFLERLDIIKEQVNHVQEAVNDKMLMENDSIQQIISEAVDFSQLQDSLRTEYTKLFPDEPVPQLIDDIEEKIRLLDESLAKQKELDEAKAVISRFSSITSDIDKCKAMLKKYLDKLQAIDAESMSIEDYKTSTKPYDVFYDAVKLDDNNERTMQAQTIYGQFDGDIIANLLFGNFYIDDSKLQNTVSENVPETIAKTTSPDKESVMTKISAVPVMAPIAEKVVEDKEDNDTSSNEAVTLFNTSLRSNVGNFEFVSNKVSVPVDHKEFKNLMKNNLAKTILALSEKGCSIPFLYIPLEDITDESLKLSADELVKAGYLESAHAADLPYVFHISARGYKAVKKYNQNRSSSFLITEDESCVPEHSINNYLMTLGTCAESFIRIKMFDSVQKEIDENAEFIDSKESKGNTYYISAGYCKILGKKGLNFLYVSFCLNGSDDAEHFVTALNDFVEEANEGYDYLFISSDTINECVICRDIINKTSDQSGKNHVVLHSVLTDEYRLDNETVNIEQLVNAMQSSISETFGVSFITDEMLENKYKETGIIVCNHSDIGVANVEYKDSINVLTKDFKKDMKIPIHKAATSLFSEYDNLNERFLRSNIWAMTPLLANISIAEKMFELGYANKITLGDFEPVYTSSNALERNLNRANVLWLKNNSRFSFKPHSVTSPSDRTPPSSPVFNNILLNAIGHLNAASPVYSVKSWKSNATSFNSSNFFRFNGIELNFPSSINVNTYIISACIPNVKELSKLIDKSKDTFSEYSNNIDIFIVAGFSKEECDSLYNYYHNNYQCFNEAKLVLYVINEDRFIDLETESDITSNDIQEYIENLYHSKLKSKMSATVDEPVSVSESEIDESSDVVENSIEQENTDAVDTDTKSTEIIRNEPLTEVMNETPVAETSNNSDEENSESVTNSFFIDDEELLDTVCGLLEKEKYACASAYLKAISMQNKSYNHLYTTLGYAMNDPALSCNYTSSVISGIFDNEASDYSDLTEFFRICAVLRTLFQGNQHDYQYKSLSATIQGYSYLNVNKYVMALLLKLSEFKDSTNGQGIDAYADYRIKENVNTSKMIDEHVKNAKTYFEQYYNNPIKEKKALPRYIETVKMILKKDNPLYDCLRAASEDDRANEILEYVHDFLSPDFINNGFEIRGSNISNDKIDEFIDFNWEQAGKVQREKHKSSKLVKELRNNLFSMLSKMLTEIADWYYYVSLYTENDNHNTYEHEKHDIVEVINNAVQVCNEIAVSGDRDRYTIAGNACIKTVLLEFQSKLNGIFIDNSNKYYYSDFLYYAEVMLDDNFIPVIENELSAINAFSPISRILRHADMPARDINERIDEIFNRTPDSDLHLSDDYGCAKLIKEYLRLAKNTEWDDDKNDIEANALDALKQMHLIKSNFIGTLELDQSYGKIDTDRKERLLLLVDKQYEKAMNTHNFGFFNRMLDYCKHTVDENASARKITLSTHLENAKKEYADTPEAQELIKSAESMMDIQNYTVVEDIINRIQQKDFTNKTALDSKDYLEDFIREYEKIFKIVYNSKISNASLITSLNRFSSGYGNKHSNFASSLINNFPTADNIQKVQSFLDAIGFNVDSVEPYQGKKACYNVSIKKPLNGKRDNYLHPIYPFGSYAVEKGFRVMCLFGKTDYNNILDAINEIGTTKNTIMIVNWALELHDRRELARKIKANMPDDKIFIVIDRVVMYYLADKNEESKSSINRILMQITAPFASFQPYMEDASKAIPSEMFMGRAKLLRDIESPKGANVICGGRQLGKSALLRMAKTDINEDDIGNRAVYVEIKNLDHREAALKVSQKLIDENILEDVNKTNNWDELARFIELRLNDKKKKKIPYFLLLIDEADSLFESSKNIDYNPIRALESLQAEENESFKFVFAGLRNLVKFERELANDDNSTLPHITVKTIRPFNNQEARELLETPLHYLGVRFPKDQEYLISLILASTNYFPGLIHQYCASLIKSMQEKDYADYTVDKTPPYELTETQIKKILSDENFNKDIKRKFDITLKLDTDNYYDIIATLVAYCSYNIDSSNGFTVSEIMEVAEDFEIKKIVSQGVDKLAALMDELCELNILRRNNENRYLFARHNFIQMLGKDKSEIDDKLIQYLGE